jgi:histidinol-phosphate aminotransferase
MMNIQPPLPVITIPTHIEALQAYQPGRPPDQLKQDLGFERFINLASNENPFGPPPNIQAAVAGAILDSNRYPESAGLKLREALAERFSISPKNVAATAQKAS